MNPVKKGERIYASKNKNLCRNGFLCVDHLAVSGFHGDDSRLVWLDGQAAVLACCAGFERGCGSGIGDPDPALGTCLLLGDLSVGCVARCDLMGEWKAQEEKVSFQLLPGEVHPSLCRAGRFRGGLCGRCRFVGSPVGSL